MASFIYNAAKAKLCNGTINLGTHTFKVMLLADTYTPSATTHTVKANIVGHEITGDGYTPGGQTLANVAWAETGGTATLDADDPIWEMASFTARYAAIYDDTASSDDLLALIDFGGSVSVSEGTFTIQFSAAGVVTLT